MKLSRELKAGITAVIALLAFIWGFNFLKGKDILTSSREFYALYSDVDGLTEGNPVTINGMQVGTVSSIKFLPDGSGNLIVTLELSTEFQFSKNSVLDIRGDGLLGGKLIAIDLKPGMEIAESGDTLIGEVEPALTTMLNNEVTPIKQKLESLMVSLDSTSTHINRLTSGQNAVNIEQSIANLNKNLYNLSVITNNLKNNTSNFDAIIANASEAAYNLNSFSDSLKKVDVNQTVRNFNSLINEMTATLDSVNNGDGSLSKLIHDDELYNNLTLATKELSELLEDIKLNPKRYVHVSVFGKKADEYKSPEADDVSN